MSYETKRRELMLDLTCNNFSVLISFVTRFSLSLLLALWECSSDGGKTSISYAYFAYLFLMRR